MRFCGIDLTYYVINLQTFAVFTFSNFVICVIFFLAMFLTCIPCNPNDVVGLCTAINIHHSED